MIGRLHNYEIVKNTLEVNKDRYLRKAEISVLTNLKQEQVSRIIKAAWKIGWVSRLETPIHDNCFGQGKFPSIKTAYKIKRTDSWAGLMPLYNKTLTEERKNR